LRGAGCRDFDTSVDKGEMDEQGTSRFPSGMTENKAKTGKKTNMALYQGTTSVVP
jgi:hypothetical protein